MSDDDEEGGDGPVSVGQAKLVRETDMAICVKLKKGNGWGEDRWFPKSVVHDNSEVWGEEEGQTGSLVVKRWFAEKEGLE